jgi:acetyl-CoA carboxylase carboxyl transferase subunit alpha
MQLADKFGVPVITLIDTPGAYPGVGAEERHIAEAIAVNLREMTLLRVPIVAVVIGEGGSGGALGIGVADRVLILENAYYSVISPEGCAAILWKDRANSARAAEALKLTAKDLKELNLVDDIIPEPLGGAHRDAKVTAESLKAALLRHLAELTKLPCEQLLKGRYQKFRKMGPYDTLKEATEAVIGIEDRRLKIEENDIQEAAPLFNPPPSQPLPPRVA